MAIANFGIGQWYNNRELPSGYTLEQIAELAKQKGATHIRLYARYGMEPIDWNLLDQVLTMLQEKGFKVIFCPFLNWKDHVGYFGSPDWITKWVDMAQRFEHDDRIWMYEIFNEPNNTTWAPTVTNIAGVHNALAQCVDAIRATGDAHPIILPDQMVYGNWSWAYTAGTKRPNTLQAFHFWQSTWTQANYATGRAFWEQWGLARILNFENANPDMEVYIDEIGVADPAAGWATLEFQQDAIVNAINWCAATDHDFSWHLFGWNYNASGFYRGKFDLIFPLTEFVPQYMLDVWTALGGTTTPTGIQTVTPGTVVTITATEGLGFTFGGWQVQMGTGPLTTYPDTENPLTLTITAATVVMPLFNTVPVPPTCPTGYHWDATANACVQDIQADFHWKAAAVLSFLTLAGLWLVSRKRKKR